MSEGMKRESKKRKGWKIAVAVLGVGVAVAVVLVGESVGPVGPVRLVGLSPALPVMGG
jgi:hypothetical protein